MSKQQFIDRILKEFGGLLVYTLDNGDVQVVDIISGYEVTYYCIDSVNGKDWTPEYNSIVKNLKAMRNQ